MQSRTTFVGSVSVKLFSVDGFGWFSDRKQAREFAGRGRPPEIEHCLRSLRGDFAGNAFSIKNYGIDPEYIDRFQIVKW